MTSIIEKRLSLHRDVKDQREQNRLLKGQIAQLQALANIGTTTCMVAHEINNLLTGLASYATMALQYPQDKAIIEKALKKTARNCRRASKIMTSMLSVVNGQATEKKNARLAALVEEIFDCLCRDFSRDSITVNISIPADVEVWAVPVEMQQVMMNLILNAREAMLPRGGILTIKAEDTGNDIRVKVSDTGCGIDTCNLDRIFEPFFTTKSRKESVNTGFGFGLAFCRRVIDSYNGSILVASEPGQGTSFEIILPKRI